MFFTPFGVQISYLVLKARLVLVLGTLASCMHVRGVYVELPQCSEGELFIFLTINYSLPPLSPITVW